MTSAVETRVQVDLARQVFAAIEREPHRWNQNSFASVRPDGTVTYCFAGWVCHLAGHDVLDELRSRPGDEGGRRVVGIAQRALGLTRRQAARLFLFMEDSEGNHPTVGRFKSRFGNVTGVRL